MTVAIENRNEPTQGTLGLAPLQQLPARADSSAQSGSASISSNDFLTLLVTEMQNQDPTANTDPNEYINQLVNVNSLEQLISINQELSGVSAPSGSEVQSPSRDAAHGASSSEARGAASSIPSATPAPGRGTLVEGNLGVPPPNASAHRIAHALGGLGV